VELEAMDGVVAARRGSFSDYVALTKTGITRMVLITAAGGMWLAPGSLEARTVVLTLVGLALIVSAANTLNCYLERDVDALMTRTRDRPLPAGRLDPAHALVFGLVLSALAVPLITFGVGPLPGFLSALALVSYVLVYTPLKRLTPLSTLVGGVPGALPPLIGWTAATGTLDPPGWVLFGILFVWQMPHFYAIGLMRKDEYEAAGLRIMPVVRGEPLTRIQMVRYASLLVPVSLLLVPMGVSGWLYGLAATFLGVAWAGQIAWGVFRGGGERWAHNVFHASLLYLTLLVVFLVLDAWLVMGS
jgi:heme o synthase